ncbi:MAG: WecB/TagA/CpsF family glycosyltransferase [Treponemataceae bacterium]|nr:WecB/TagA/CpsF family glycosyltransferase [Treponemataceae bacterium]
MGGGVERIDILGIPVDVVSPEDLEKTIFRLLDEAGTKQIIFLNIWKLIRATHSQEYAQCVKSAALVLPVSKSILKAAKFLKQTVPYRYSPFDTLIRILTSLESRYKSLFLLGGHKSSLLNAQRNIQSTYPGLQVVGRYVGYFPKAAEKNVIEGIYKANPSLVLVCDGLRHGELWPYERRNQFGSSFFIYNKDAIDILSLRKKRLSKTTFDRGHEAWTELGHNPLRIFLIIPYMGFKIRLLWWRLFKLKKVLLAQAAAREQAEAGMQKN